MVFSVKIFIIAYILSSVILRINPASAKFTDLVPQKIDSTGFTLHIKAPLMVILTAFKPKYSNPQSNILCEGIKEGTNINKMVRPA